MSLHRYNARRDYDEKLYVELFRKAGITVKRNSESGAPDLLLTKVGFTPVEVEVKTAKTQEKAIKKLTIQQKAYWELYQGIKKLRLVWDVMSCISVIEEDF